LKHRTFKDILNKIPQHIRPITKTVVVTIQDTRQITEHIILRKNNIQHLLLLKDKVLSKNKYTLDKDQLHHRIDGLNTPKIF
jgi:hypothetical protein